MKRYLIFDRFSDTMSKYLGSPQAFSSAVILTIFWAASGPILGFGTEWNFWANTTTTIATFLMVFLLQNSQNRTTQELHQNTEELKKMVRRMALDNRRVLAKLESIEEDIEELVEDELDDDSPKVL